ncbi:MAG: O-antigen ligase family protein [Chitinophagales bacterium]|nr:O-antigen ligase family protein [Chitinophagales bacterium]
MSILVVILIPISCFVFLLLSPNKNSALERIWSKLPFLLIPLSLVFNNARSKQYFYFFVAFLIFMLNISGIIVLINFFYNLEYYKEIIAQGKHIPVPIDHIRYSLMLAFGGVSSIFFFFRKNTFLSKFDRFFFGFSAIFIFILLHILSVRSGLVSYYLATLFTIIFLAIESRKYFYIPILVIVLALSPYLAYHNIPSFKNKLDYMKYDLMQLREGEVGHNSDARRWRSIELGWKMYREKPLLGFGLGNMEAAVNAFYEENYSEVEEYNRKLPHNQFLFTAVEMGFFGILILFLALFFPLVVAFKQKNVLFIILSIIILSSCMVENTLESQLGISFYLIFASLSLKSYEEE